MSKIILGIFSFLILLTTSCKNELDLNAPYKEIMVVYGLLDANDSVHYIKVNRAFTTENQSAYEIAKITDSLYYDSIKVELTEVETGKIIVFNKDYSVEKDSGIFANTTNIVYTSSEKLKNTYTYKATVTNLISGNQTSATTNMVRDPLPVSPSYTSSYYTLDTAKQFQLIFNTAINAEIYDASMMLFWEEYDKNNVFMRRDSLSYPLLTGIEPGTSGKFNVKYDVKSYLNYLVDHIPVKADIERVAKTVSFHYWGANNEYLTYKNIYAPSTTLVQKKPEYTNFSNGNFGLLASRNHISLSNIPLVEQFRNSPITQKLNFR